MEFIEKEIEELKNKGLYRKLRTVETAQGHKVRIDGREVILLCSNDYLGLANHRKVKEAARKAIVKYGFGAGASRLVSGTMALHRQLEEKIAEFKGTEAALLFNSGYAANSGAIPAIAGKGDLIFSDRLNHASIVDGCRLSLAEVRRYRHLDMNALERYLEHAAEDEVMYAQKLIVTDGIFSMDGDIAPIDRIVELAKTYGAMVMVDEAHGTGVLGAKGRGSVEHSGVDSNDITVNMGTFGKALGSYGAYIAGARSMIDYIMNRSRSFIYSTALPPSTAAATLAAIDIVDQEPQRREKLHKNAAFMKKGLDSLGFETMDSETQIIPVLAGESSLACKMMDSLLEQGIFVLAIRPPTVPEGTARLRVTVTSQHTRADISRALDAFKKSGKEVGII
ncbi:MAG: 8-amino-7-oxononanoate synthase [Deltaproteobacteria bacterium]|nr:8-amino-7-oxononanoate synthase [Deltaproteobacteria bacterium]